MIMVAFYSVFYPSILLLFISVIIFKLTWFFIVLCAFIKLIAIDLFMQCFLSLRNVVHKLLEADHDWFGRVKLIDCICNLISLHPQIGQVIFIFFMARLDYSEPTRRIILIE